MLALQARAWQGSYAEEPRWRVTAYPGAGEVSISWLPNTAHAGLPRRLQEAGHQLRGAVQEDAGDQAQEEHAESNRERSARRSRATIRRFVLSTNLTHMWTLTYADDQLPPDAGECRRHVSDLAAKIAKHLYPVYGHFPWVAVIERGDATGRLHVHLACDRFLRWQDVNRCWSHDGVLRGATETPKRVRKDGSAFRLADVASYLSAYVKKGALALRDELPKGRQCYSRSEGFEVKKQSYLASDYRDAQIIAAAVCTGQGGLHWVESGDWKDYSGPPASWATWRPRGDRHKVARALHGSSSSR